MIDHDQHVRFILNDPKTNLLAFSALLFFQIKLQAVIAIIYFTFNLKIFFDNL
jgi:hypothetical protein